MLSIVINMKIMKWYTMFILFVDLGVVVHADTEWAIWDFDTKIREKSWSWTWSSNKKSCLGLGLENYEGLGLEIQSLGLGLDKKVLVLSYSHHWALYGKPHRRATECHRSYMGSHSATCHLTQAKQATHAHRSGIWLFAFNKLLYRCVTNWQPQSRNKNSS